MDIEEMSKRSLLFFFIKITFTLTKKFSFTTFYRRDDLIVNEIINGKISFAFEGMSKFPRNLVDVLRHDITHLDLSMNKIRDFSFLRGFKNLSSLIVDGNTNMDMDTLPSNDKLELFYANKCNIEFPRSFIFRVSVAFKSLKYFSMMSNPVLKQQCTRHVWEGSEHRMRMFAIFMNPNMQHFNDEKISPEQKAHSKSFHSYLGPVDCKQENSKTLSDTDDVWKILPLHLQQTTAEYLKFQDEEDKFEEKLSKISIAEYLMNFEFDNNFIKKIISIPGKQC